jgi:hypothetical protein
VTGPIDFDETYQYSFTVTDINGVPVDAGGPPTVTITLPDGSTAAPTVVDVGAGLYAFDYKSPQIGRHVARGVATGGTLGSATEVFEDIFHVEPPGRMLVGVDEAVSALSGVASLTSREDREQLRWLILAVSDRTERYLGRTLARTPGIVDYFDGGTTQLRLSHQPLPYPDGNVTIASVVVNGTTLVLNTDYILRRTSGIWRLQRGTSSSVWSWDFGYEKTVVTYTAETARIPADLRQIVLNQIRQEWQSLPANSLVSEVSVGQVSVSYSKSSMAELDRYRVRGIA